MQSVYSFSQRENGKLEEELKFFDASVSQSFELYTALLGLIKALMDLVQDQLKVHEKIGSVDVKYQHLKLLSNNRVMLMIQQHALLEKKLQSKNTIKWDLEFVFLKELLQKITSDTAFNDYQKNTDPQWEDDLNWFSRCFKKHIASSDFLYDYLEDQNLTWIDDLPLVNTFLSKMFKQLAPDQHNSLPFPEFVKNQEDIVFGRQLLEKVIVKDEELQKELEGKTPNWDPERIARLDGVVLKIAIAELLYFPNIPTKVTLNEYLEIIKDYSTPNSNNFVNGVLDKLVKEFSLENRLNKSGRGLL
ncbi:MAG: transcription antitermination factor NusB [Flavobacteriaceae bacterium]